MKFVSTLYIIFALLIVSFESGCSSPTDAAVASGKANFKGYGCQTCHKVDNVGGVIGPDLTYIGFRKSPEWLDMWLKDPNSWKPHTLMPNFYLNDQARKSLVEYLSSLRGGTYVESPPWNHAEFADDPIKKGKAIFEGAGCIGCHGSGGSGRSPNNNVVGGQIPSLLYVSDGYSKDELKDKIRKGSNPAKADPNGPDPMIHMPEWGQVLKDEELEALAEYLFSLKPATSSGDDWGAEEDGW